MTRRGRSSTGARDRGVTAITVAIGLMLLMGLAAVAVDGSNLYRERGDDQNAADLAAYAAAYISCLGGTDAEAIAAGQAQALANGYDDTDPDVTVTIVRVGSQWEVTVDTTIDGFFSKVLGANTLDTGASALAECSKGHGPSIFAGGHCGSDPTFDMSGNENLMIGAVHSNSNLKVGGGLNEFTDEVTYVTTEDINAGNTFPPGSPYQVPWKPWPAGMQMNPAHYADGGFVESLYPGQFYEYYTNGDVFIDSSTPNGVHVIYGNGKFLFNEDNITKTLTLVILPTSSDKGTIEISKSGLNITAFHNGVVFYTEFWKGGTDYPYDGEGPYASNPECGAPAIQQSSEGNIFTGLFVAPRGMIEFNGNKNILNGGLAGFNLKYNGNENTMNTLAGLGNPITVLIE